MVEEDKVRGNAFLRHVCVLLPLTSLSPSLPPLTFPLPPPPPCSGPSSAYLHSAAFLWDSLMIVFGGSSTEECFSDQLLVYNIG